VSARNRAAYNWHILRSIGEKLRDVFEADMAKPLPGEIAELLRKFKETERGTNARPLDASHDDAIEPPAAAPRG
jgi:hypothetical protein